MREARLLLMAGMALLTSGCFYNARIERAQTYSDPGSVVSPHDEEGGRFDGARVSPGFGVMYLHGYSDEAADQPQCGGYFGEEPDHVLEVTHLAYFKLEIHATSTLVLGLRGPDGTFVCGEDPSPINANVALTRVFEPGRWEVWVGERQRQVSTGYRLVLSE